MLKTGIRHPELARLLASLGHGDKIIVSDAGFPVPRGVERIDLGIARDLPELVPVLALLDDALFCERILYAEEIATNHPQLHGRLRSMFSDAAHAEVPHAEIIGDHAREAVAIVRTGSFDPWGNVVLVAGTDPFAWFDRPGTVTTPFYVDRQRAVQDRARREARTTLDD